MGTHSLLYQDRIDITDKIHILIPTVGEIIDEEDDYYNTIGLLTSMPVDMMVMLEDSGIDFTTINEYELFLILFNGLKQRNTKLVFGDLHLDKFQLAANEETKEVILLDVEDDIVIDRATYTRIANTIRKIHHLEKNKKKPANEEAKKYMIERARKKLRRKQGGNESQLEGLIVALVNTEQFKYDFESVRDISIYQFNESVRQIISKIDYEHRMHGVYAGTISAKDLSQDDMNWLKHK